MGITLGFQNCRVGAKFSHQRTPSFESVGEIDDKAPLTNEGNGDAYDGKTEYVAESGNCGEGALQPDYKNQIDAEKHPATGTIRYYLVQFQCEKIEPKKEITSEISLAGDLLIWEEQTYKDLESMAPVEEDPAGPPPTFTGPLNLDCFAGEAISMDPTTIKPGMPTTFKAGGESQIIREFSLLKNQNQYQTRVKANRYVTEEGGTVYAPAQFSAFEAAHDFVDLLKASTALPSPPVTNNYYAINQVPQSELATKYSAYLPEVAKSERGYLYIEEDISGEPVFILHFPRPPSQASGILVYQGIYSSSVYCSDD